MKGSHHSRGRFFSPDQFRAWVRLQLRGFPLGAVISQLEQLFQLLDGIVWVGNRVTDRPGITVDLIIISAREALVAKEVDIFIFDSSDLLLCLDVAETVGLIPTSGEDVERDLSAD